MATRILAATRKIWPLLTLAVLAAGCAGAGLRSPDTSPDHPLAGRIWDVRAGAFVDYPTLLGEAAMARHVLLGEIHINGEHHEIQARIVEDLNGLGPPRSLVFEIFEQGQQPDIDRAAARPGVTTGTLADATGIRDSGWNWDSYEPLVGLALSEGMPIRAGNAPLADVNRVAREGAGTLPESRLADLGLAAPLPPSAHAALTETIVASHCGHVFGDMTERLIAAQRLRDATMAEVMITSRPGETVLITGAGHARRDYGVPFYVAGRDPSATVLSIGLTEVRPQRLDPAEYVDRLEGLEAPFDYLWFTSRTVSEDPCEQFRDQLRELQDRDSGDGPDDPTARTPAPVTRALLGRS